MIDFQFVNTEIPGFNSEFFISSISKLIESENRELGDVTYVFVNDDYLLDINQRFLNHDYYTDIITFDYCENNLISGDLLISIDRVVENSQILKIDFHQELHRVILHGILHLCGYKDKTMEEEIAMRDLENKYLK
jgi:probable rRNA maturation factor